MGYTITEKILLSHTDKKKIPPGEFIIANVDFCFGNDITAPIAIDKLKRLGVKRLFNPDRIALIPDHFTPAKDAKSANQCKILKEFSSRYGIKNYFEIGRVGIEHALLPELGLIMPGDVVVGADSHTCTYGAIGAFSTGIGSTDLAGVFMTGRCWFKVPHSIKVIFKGKLKKWVGGKDLILYVLGKIGVDGAHYKAIEFSGEVIHRLGMDDRFSLCNMAIEAGAKSGIIEPDEITRAYIKSLGKRWHKRFEITSDRDAEYADIFEFDVSSVQPQIAFPHLPSNVRAVDKATHINIDQVVIGSCTNGRISDLRVAAKVLKGHRVNSRVRLIIIPATQKIYMDAMREGLVKVFLDSGGVFTPPTCGPCLGGHMGILAEGERAVSTTNRNFVGRMGHPNSEVYLCNPAVAAATAIKGRIAHPDEI